jgi:hypothetical protein
MSCLKLYAPIESDFQERRFSIYEDPEEVGDREEGEPEILSWNRIATQPRTQNTPSLMELLARTRTLYRNKRCRSCNRPTVEPVEMDDALVSKNRMPVPGSATLVGFQCQYCRHEWSL